MTFLDRQRLRPGISGVSSRPIDPAEAYRVENMVLQRDGVWAARPGLVAIGPAVDAISHVSNLDMSTNLAVIEGGRLRVFDTDSQTFAGTLSSGWPSGWIHHSSGGGTGATDWYWLAAKVNRFDISFGEIYKINGNTLAGADISSAPLCQWVTQHATYTIAVRDNEFAWSAPGNSDSWSGADAITCPRFLRFPRALLALNESQALIFGDFGVGQLMGNTPDSWTIGQLYPNMVLWPRTAVLCGDRVFALGSGINGTRVYFFNPGMYRVDAPIESELEGLAVEKFWAWYDPIGQNYCLSHSVAKKTWIFDLEKNRWAGTITRHLVGLGLKPGNYGYARIYGLGGQMVVLGRGPEWSDSAGSYKCVVETRPDTLQIPETEKQASAIYLDGSGNWTVTLKHRNAPDASWTEDHMGTVSAPGWVHLPVNFYRERALRFEGVPSSTLRFRGVEFDERVVGTP